MFSERLITITTEKVFKSQSGNTGFGKYIHRCVVLILVSNGEKWRRISEFEHEREIFFTYRNFENGY